MCDHFPMLFFYYLMSSASTFLHVCKNKRRPVKGHIVPIHNEYIEFWLNVDDSLWLALDENR